MANVAVSIWVGAAASIGGMATLETGEFEGFLVKIIVYAP